MVVLLDDSGVHATGRENGGDNRGERPNGQQGKWRWEHIKTETMWTFFQVGLELESTGSGRQQGVDGTTWRR